MDELLSFHNDDHSPREEIAFLLAMAILRKHRRSLDKEPPAPNKEPVRLDNSPTSCLTVDTPSENDRGSL